MAGYPLWVSTLAAKPARLTTNRHGTYSLRWIVPLRLRDEHGRPREVRISLRTRDDQQARILALEFNLALERNKAMSRPDPSTTAPWSIQAGTVKIEVNGSEDQRLFQEAMKQDPDMRAALMDALRSGTPPADAMAALIAQVKGAVDGAAGVDEPTLLSAAVAAYLKDREPLGKNRRSTAGEKRRTLEFLMEFLPEHLASKGKDLTQFSVHELKRPMLISFVAAYAKRLGKDDIQAAKEMAELEKAAEAKVKPKPKPKQADAETEEADTQGLSPRTVLKAVSHLHDFFVYALAKNWIAADPLDDAFDKAISGIKDSAAAEKAGGGYTVFNDVELAAIFEPRRYLLNNNSSDDFWCPLVALFTGARAGEIVTLQVDAIEQDADSGVWIMNIATTKKGRKGKNENSRRRVPVPEALMSLGLIDYVQHVKALGGTALFPHRKINPTRMADPSKHLSRVFAAHLNDLEIKDPRKVFHSFRHTVITRMHVKGVPVGDAELIVGHAAQDLHERISESGGRGGRQRTSVHLGTYADAAGYEDPGIKLLQRLKMHLDFSLAYPIDVERLRRAAIIVREHLTVSRVGSSAQFSSGWHTNKKTYAQQITDGLISA